MHVDLATLLHLVWIRVDWAKMGTSHKRTRGDVFLRRVRRAAHATSLANALERVCTGLDVGALDLPLDVLLRLELDENQVLGLLREHAVLVTALAEQGPGVLLALIKESERCCLQLQSGV